MKATITRIYHFEATHQLPEEFGGPATRLHGHSYTLRVTVAAGVRTEDLDDLWESHLRAQLDHVVLNDYWLDTTVEGLSLALLCAFGAEAIELQEGDLRYARVER